jgi:hypothetical protein
VKRISDRGPRVAAARAFPPDRERDAPLDAFEDREPRDDAFDRAMWYLLPLGI